MLGGCLSIKSIFSLFLLIFYFSVILQAETHEIIMDGGTSRHSNYFRFYNAVRRGYETLKYLDRNPKIIAKDGTWTVFPQHNEEGLSRFSLTELGKLNYPSFNSVTYPPIDRAATSLEDLNSLIKTINPKAGDTLLLYVTPHGFPSTDPEKPELAELGLWNKTVTYKELGDLLSNFKDIKFKITTTACFGGGIHHIARSLDNVCT